ncbi:MAG: hypothetical protein M0R06_14595 [Sphaerochaeta sp.]|jgi:hypothetical protein|nr:hypothetical protein [Sphaerochaeta sp.]
MRCDIYQSQIIRKENLTLDMNVIKKYENNIRRGFDSQLCFEDNVYCIAHDMMRKYQSDIFGILLAAIKMTYYEKTYLQKFEDDICDMVKDYIFREHKKPTIFIDSQDLLEILFEMTFENMEDNFTTPLKGIMSYAFKEDIKIENEPIKAMRIIESTIPYKYYANVIVKNNLGFNSYLFEDMKSKSVFEIDCNEGPWFHDKQDMMEIMKLNVEKEEKGIERAIIYSKLIYMLSKYIEAFPEYLISGFPDEYNTDGHNKHGIFMRLMVPKKLSDIKKRIKPHEVRMHTRHLRSTRFKRNPDGSIREITIEKYWTGGPLTPYVLKEKVQ